MALGRPYSRNARSRRAWAAPSVTHQHSCLDRQRMSAGIGDQSVWSWRRRRARAIGAFCRAYAARPSPPAPVRRRPKRKGMSRSRQDLGDTPRRPCQMAASPSGLLLSGGRSGAAGDSPRARSKGCNTLLWARATHVPGLGAALVARTIPPAPFLRGRGSKKKSGGHPQTPARWLRPLDSCLEVLGTAPERGQRAASSGLARLGGSPR